jgi:predicted permease
LEALKISLFGIIIIAFGMAMIWMLSKLWHIEQRRLGAAMLATAFPNVTYLGLPSTHAYRFRDGAKLEFFTLAKRAPVRFGSP